MEWNLDRPFLTGQFHQEAKTASFETKPNSLDLAGSVIDCYNASVQELIVIGNLLSALIGIEGRYITINKVRGNEDFYSFHLDGSMDLALQESAKRIFRLCKSYLLINKFVECYETLGPSTSNEILDRAMLSSKPSVIVGLYAESR
ncbi:gamma-tubulin complex component 2 [Tanacetum coccineum]